ncbi:hypothetical protein ALMP_73150 [Streptomyces sp. A012304]|nr:hypothetical protein ALMP_73150 [Streptomyces sp. A012304]
MDVIELLTQVWPEENNEGRWHEYLQEQEESGNGARRGVWVLDDDGRVLAVATVERRRPKTIEGRTWPVYLAYLTTDRDHRREGHAARLEHHVMRELEQQGYSGAYLRVNREERGWKEALEFWERQGWEQTVGSPPILMIKQTATSPPLGPS